MLACLLASGCARGEPSAGPGDGAVEAADGGSAASTASASATPSASAPRAHDVPFARQDEPAEGLGAELAVDAPFSATEARRTTVALLADEPALAPHEARLREHFGGAIPYPLELQAIDLHGSRKALLVTAAPPDVRPLVLVSGSAGEVLWAKEHPLAGMRPGVTEVALMGGPEGDVTVVWYDGPSHALAMRMWGATGAVIADFQLLEVSACDAVSGLYWPGKGFLAAASDLGWARAQLLTERGTAAWGHAGEAWASARPARAPVSMVLDTDDSVMVFQIGIARDVPGKSAPEHVLVSRYDATGKALWQAPRDLGSAAGTPDRIPLRRVSPGRVRAVLGGQGARHVSVEVTSAGAVSRL